MALSLKALRQAAGLTQSALAKQARIHQPNLSLIESGRTDPSFSLVENYLANLDLKLVAVPKSVPDINEFTYAIDDALHNHEWEEAAFRTFFELDNRLRELDGSEISVAAINPFESTHDFKFDALVEGLIEYHLNSNGAPLPKWLREKKRVLTEPWNTAGPTVTASRIAANSPDEFFERNVYLHWKDLLSV